MVKGTPNTRSFQSKESPTKAMRNISPARPPLSAFSASTRNNLSAGNSSPASKPQAKLDWRSPQATIRGSFSGQASYPFLENVDSNIGSSSSNSSSPERFSTPCGTLWKSKSRRSSGIMRLPFSSTNTESVQGQNSPGMVVPSANLHYSKSLHFKLRGAISFTIGVHTLCIDSVSLPNFFAFTNCTSYKLHTSPSRQKVEG